MRGLLWIIKYLICDMLKNFIKKPCGTSFAQKHLENICNSDEKADTWLEAFAKLILGPNLTNVNIKELIVLHDFW